MSIVAALGAEVRTSRDRRRKSQAALGADVGLAQTTISLAERGHGGRLSLETWQAIATALGRRLEVRFSADVHQEPADAGHLAIQELVLRLGRHAGFARTFELPTKPADPVRSADIGLRDDRKRRLLLVECWNTIGDVGAAVRSSTRKLAEADALAAATAPVGPDGTAVTYRVSGCWVVRATARNRALLARYPEVFAARFPGSSVAWVRALTMGSEPPVEPGLVWADLRGTRVFAWRRRD